MKDEEFKSRVKSLLFLAKETEWVEFKLNQSDPHEIGEYISALSNSAALHHEINRLRHFFHRQVFATRYSACDLSQHVIVP